MKQNWLTAAFFVVIFAPGLALGQHNGSGAAAHCEDEMSILAGASHDGSEIELKGGKCLSRFKLLFGLDRSEHKTGWETGLKFPIAHGSWWALYGLGGMSHLRPIAGLEAEAEIGYLRYTLIGFAGGRFPPATVEVKIESWKLHRFHDSRIGVEFRFRVAHGPQPKILLTFSKNF